MKRIYCLIFILFAAIGLSGCASILPAHSVSASVSAANNANPNVNRQASPVVVMFYQLKGINAFNGSDFATLYQNPQQALGKDYISEGQVEVAPGQTVVYEDKLDPKATYLGIVAAYRNIGSSIWRRSVKFQSTWATETLKVHVGRNKVTVEYLL